MMPKRFFPRLLALGGLLTAFAVTVSTTPIALAAGAVNDADVVLPGHYATGALPMDDSELMAHRWEPSEDAPQPLTYVPSGNADNSRSSAFPPIRDQGSLGSCVAFSTVYYQFTYAVNRLHGTSAANPANQFSPKAVYNVYNGGTADSGMNAYQAYVYLSEHGCLSWEDFPYDADYTALPTDLSQMCEALNTRLADNSYYTRQLPDAGTPYSDRYDPDLDSLKLQLDMGNIFSVTVPTGRQGHVTENWVMRTASNGELALCRVAEGSSSHQMTVVGYNDNIWCDLNGNGKGDPGELGALKVANSWGTDWGNNGYIWILYDTMNQISAVSNWESGYTGKRVAIFSNSNGNWFHSIEAEDKEVYFVADVVLNNVTRNNVDVENIGRRRNTSYAETALCAGSLTGTGSYTGHMVFDYEKLCDPILLYKSNYQWEIGPFPAYSTAFTGNIVDNHGNLIKACTKSGSKYVAPVNLIKGDVNYDGKINTTDGSLVLSYATGKREFSNVQLYLADYDGNGKVDSTDARLILQAGM